MDSTQSQIGSLRRMAWPLAVGTVVLVGLAVRLFVAWAEQYVPNPDTGIVQLMTKHMAEGSGFPAFFYGQPYMGSLEPAVSALLSRVFGISCFTVALGTVLVGSLVLPLLYVWGRDAGGRPAGLLALLYGVVGSAAFLHYSVTPRGGYMAMLVCGVTTLWLAARVAARLRSGQRVAPWRYAVLGLVAGLGWWSSQLVTVFLLAAVMILLAGFRVSMVTTGLLPALAGFAVGSLPWWLWNLTHEWRSFDFAGSLGKVPFTEGADSLWGQFLLLTEINSSGLVWTGVRLTVLIGLALWFLAILVRDRLRADEPGPFFAQLAVPALAVSMLLVYSTSHYARFHGTQYVLPLLPGVAVMLGTAAGRMLVWKRIPLGVILFLAVMPVQVLSLHRVVDARAHRPEHDWAVRLADDLAPRCGGAVMADWGYHWVNFASREKLCLADIPKERYAPYGQRVELADDPAVLANCRRIRTFLAYTQGRSTPVTLQGTVADCDLRPPPDAWRYVEPDRIQAAEDGTRASCLAAVTDVCLDTGWSGSVDKRAPASLTFTFSRPVALNGIRLLSNTDDYPGRIAIDGQGEGGDSWVALMTPEDTTSYFWSGPHVLFDGIQLFQEFRFNVPNGGVSRVRLTFSTGARELPYDVNLAEVLFLDEAPPPTAAYPTADRCLAALRRHGVKKVYAPRWLSERVWTAAGGRIDAPVSSLLKRTAHDIMTRDRTLPEAVTIGGATAFVVDGPDAERTRRVLQQHGLSWQEEPLDRYTLLVVRQPDPARETARFPTLYWSDMGCFSADMTRFAKARAQTLFEQPVGASAEARIGKLSEALALYPAHQPARKALIALLNAAGRRDEAAAQAAVLKQQTEPGTASSIRFAGGAEFLGLTMVSREVRAGGTLEVDYYWKCPPAAAAARLAAFVHFQKGKERFQDDYVMLEDSPPDDLRYQPFDEVFVQHRRVAVPASMLPGEYGVATGLFRRDNNKRVAMTTDLPTHRRAADLPVTVRVVP